MSRYPDLPAAPNFVAMEKEILKFWQDNAVFEKSVDFRPQRINGKSNEFVFYDGPPFANGLPHYGHLLTGYVKDLVPRYQTMKGHHVSRRFGWDCHGLPAELSVEPQLGISGAKAIQDYGIEKFNAACEADVTRYTEEWVKYVTRQGRWVSFKEQYRTMDRNYMESVIWAFKTLYNKGLIYEGYRVVAYSWAAQSPVSNFETRMDNAYRERTDPTLTVGFKLKETPLFDLPVRVLAWTTTPWTLPSNMALCVNPEFTYQLLEKNGEGVIIAENARERYARELEGYTVVKEVKGTDLVGLSYTPLFPYFSQLNGAFKVIQADFVDAESGTGVVHIAPGFGEDDMVVGKAFGVPTVVPVDDAGKFTDEVSDYAGMNVILEANDAIIRDLKKQPGVVLKHDQILHSYPHCWRTDQPLIYKAISSWYLEVSRFKDRMVELNQGITWVPGHIKDGTFGNWLANARDWNISRNRFWGAPIPVWKSDDDNYPRVDVYGSIEELEKDFGVKVENLHRPYIDDLVRPNPDDPTGKSMMRRVPEILDCWFESGSMPFAQVHYPFENQEKFEQNFPGDFIVEYISQTRGWFYLLMVLSTALFDRAPFKNCICHGVVLDVNNQKISKRLRNYPDPAEVMNTLGSDALRWYLLSSPLTVGGDLSFAEDDSDIIKSMRLVIMRLWNAFYFFTLYANADNVEGHINTSSTHPLDLFILGKTRRLIEDIETNLDQMNIPAAFNAAVPYIEALNNWFIRNRRNAFWAEEMSADKQAAYDTLYTTLVYATKALAPLMPFLSEYMHRALTGEESVHLTDWPIAKTLPTAQDIVVGMDLAREACSAILKLREQHRRRVRLPLKKAIIAHPNISILEPYVGLIQEAVNIVEIERSHTPAQFGKQAVKVNPKLGATFGSQFKEIMTAQRSDNWTLNNDGTLSIAGATLQSGDFELRYVVEGDSPAESFDSWKGLVTLDITIYPELEVQGWSRDLVRFIQQTRKDKGLHISDRIHATLQMPPAMSTALTPHLDYIQRETLAQNIVFQETPLNSNPNFSEEIGDQQITLTLEKVT